MQERWAADPTPPPALFEEATWVPWVRTLLGGWQQDRELRRAEHDCVQEHKAKGVIR